MTDDGKRVIYPAREEDGPDPHIAAHVLRALIAACGAGPELDYKELRDFRDVVVPRPLPGAGRMLRECDDQQLGALAIFCSYSIVPFGTLVRGTNND